MDVEVQPQADSSKINRYIVVTVSIVVLIICAVVIAILLFKSDGDDSQNTPESASENSDDNAIVADDDENQVIVDQTESIKWMFNGASWSASATASQCSDPLQFRSPVEASLPSSILYPGQYRGGHYKAHGGFRFDTLADNEVDVVIPMDSYLYSGSRYIEGGEIQYLLDFVSPCGVLFRFDHLLTLSPDLMTIVERDLPEAKVDDTRGTFLTDETLFKAGDLIATEVGSRDPLNVSVDFGVYDLRSQNQISQNSDWAQLHSDNISQAYFAICWIDYLIDSDREVIEDLRQIGNEGNVSDYCEI